MGEKGEGKLTGGIAVVVGGQAGGAGEIRIKNVGIFAQGPVQAGVSGPRKTKFFIPVKVAKWAGPLSLVIKAWEMLNRSINSVKVVSPVNWMQRRLDSFLPLFPWFAVDPGPY